MLGICSLGVAPLMIAIQLIKAWWILSWCKMKDRNIFQDYNTGFREQKILSEINSLHNNWKNYLE